MPQPFLVLRLCVLWFYSLISITLVTFCSLLYFKGIGIAASSIGPIVVYGLASAVVSALWVPAMLIIELVRPSTPSSKIWVELCWLGFIWLLSLSGPIALNARVSLASLGCSKDKHAVKSTCEDLFIAEVLGWAGPFVLLFYILPFVILTIKHSAECPHLLGWRVPEFEWSVSRRARVAKGGLEIATSPSVVGGSKRKPQWKRVSNAEDLSHRQPLSMQAADFSDLKTSLAHIPPTPALPMYFERRPSAQIEPDPLPRHQITAAPSFSIARPRSPPPPPRRSTQQPRFEHQPVPVAAAPGSRSSSLYSFEVEIQPPTAFRPVGPSFSLVPSNMSGSSQGSSMARKPAPRRPSGSLAGLAQPRGKFYGQRF